MARTRDRAADLLPQIDEYRLYPMKEICQSTQSSHGSCRTGGDGEHGYGEDITYDNDDQYTLIEDTEPFSLSEFSGMITSLFHPDAPNDVALSEYNDPEPQARLPMSFLQRQTYTV